MRLSGFLPALLAITTPAPVLGHGPPYGSHDAKAAPSWVPSSTAGSDLLAAASLLNLTIAWSQGTLKSDLATQGVGQKCNWSNVAIRREYSALSKAERLAYSNAVLCLMDRPAVTPSSVCPGCKSRYDDFVALHVNMTFKIHLDTWFLPWHRQFVWEFENALRTECGYRGYLPYWSYGKTKDDIKNSPHLDGSPYSQSGNGAYERHNCTQGLPTGLDCIEPESGGGCITSGPYAGRMVNISATLPTWPGITAGIDSLGYQPRCIRRDISQALSSKWSDDDQVVDLLTNPAYQTGIGAWQDRLQYSGNATFAWYGLHQFGHFAIHGDPSGDVAVSPGEPMFWLHHGMVDRMWWIWQNQDVSKRMFDISGTITMQNSPPSRNGTIEDVLELGYLGQGRKYKEVVSSMGGDFCYIYL